MLPPDDRFYSLMGVPGGHRERKHVKKRLCGTGDDMKGTPITTGSNDRASWLRRLAEKLRGVRTSS
jgi:hypothetical protein